MPFFWVLEVCTTLARFDFGMMDLSSWKSFEIYVDGQEESFGFGVGVEFRGAMPRNAKISSDWLFGSWGRESHGLVDH